MKNKGMWKLIGSLLVLFFVLLLITPNVISEAAERKVYTADIKYVNPLYADIISEEDLEDTPSVYFGDGEIEYHDTIAEAAAEMREQMEARTETIVIGIEYGEFIEDVAHYIFNDALLHTGVPTQGDYLAFTYGGWSGSLSGLECEDGYEITITYTMKYYTTAAQEAQMDIAVDNLLDELDLYEADDYSKVCGIYDYICDNVVYDYENLENSEYKLMYTAYAALMDKTAVCQGYANLLYRLALELDVDARIIAGDAGGPHAWNIVKLGNWYYNLDSTWDAGEDEYDYFLKNPEGFVDHIRREEYETEAFHAAYPMSEVDYVDRPEEEPDEPGEEPGDEPVVGVVINAESFPDTVFRQYVSEQFDTDADGVLSEQEADVFSIDVTNMGIQSLKGIEYFKTLVSLVCKSNDSLTALDVSQNTKLELLWCEWSPIGVLDVSNNPELQYLYCTNCELTELDVTNNPKLSWLHCDQNDISELDLRYNPDLEKLQCYDMNLTELDLSNNPKIFYLLCHGNELSELNVSNLSNLDTLWCSGNRLTQLDLSNNLKISSVRCEVNQLAELDVSMLDELI